MAQRSKVNLLTAPPEVLAALNEDDALEPLSAQQVARIIELRNDGMLNEVDTFIEDVMFSDGATDELRDLVDIKSSWFLPMLVSRLLIENAACTVSCIVKAALFRLYIEPRGSSSERSLR